jgi:hypothetical protein
LSDTFEAATQEIRLQRCMRLEPSQISYCVCTRLLRAHADVRKGANASALNSALAAYHVQPSRARPLAILQLLLSTSRDNRRCTEQAWRKQVASPIVLFGPDGARQQESYSTQTMASPMRTMRLAQARPCLAARRPASLQTSFLAPSPTGRMFQTCSGATPSVQRCVAACGVGGLRAAAHHL